MADLSYVVEVTGSEKLGALATGIEQVTAALSNGKDTAAKLAALKAELKGFGNATDSFKDFGSKFDAMQGAFKSSLDELAKTLKAESAIIKAQATNLAVEVSDGFGKILSGASGKVKAEADEIAARLKAAQDAASKSKAAAASRDLALNAKYATDINTARQQLDDKGTSSMLQSLQKRSENIRRLIEEDAVKGKATALKAYGSDFVATMEKGLKGQVEVLAKHGETRLAMIASQGTSAERLQEAQKQKQLGADRTFAAAEAAIASKALADRQKEMSGVITAANAFLTQRAAQREKQLGADRTFAAAEAAIASKALADSAARNAKLEALMVATSPSAMYKSNSRQARIDNIFGSAQVTPQPIPIPKADDVAKVGALSSAFKKLTVDGNDAHSMARGLASGFNLLWLTWGNLVPLFAGAGVSFGLKKTFDIGSEVEYSIKQMEMLGQTTATEGKAIRQALRDIDQTTQFSLLELSKGMVVLGQAGKTPKQALEMLKPAADLASLGMVSLDTSINLLIQTQALFGKSSKDTGDIAAKIFQITKSGVLNVEDIAGSMKYASEANTRFGKSMEETLVILGALASAGLKGPEGGTAYINFLRDINGRSGPAVAALKQLGDLTGKTIEVFDKFGKQRSAIDIFNDISAASDKLSSKDADKLLAKIFSDRGGRTFFAMVRDGTIDLKEMLKAVEGASAIDLFKSAQGLRDTVKGAADVLSGSLVGALDKVFEINSDKFKTFILDLTKFVSSTDFLVGVQGMVDSVGYLYDKLKQALPYLIAFGEAWLVFKAASVGLAIFGSIASGVMGLSGALSTLLPVLATTSATFAAGIVPGLVATAGGATLAAKAMPSLVSIFQATGAAAMGTAAASKAASLGLDAVGISAARTAATAAAATGPMRLLAIVTGFLANPIVGVITTLGLLGLAFWSAKKDATAAVSETTTAITENGRINIAQWNAEIAKLGDRNRLLGRPYAAQQADIDGARSKMLALRAETDELQSKADKYVKVMGADASAKQLASLQASISAKRKEEYARGREVNAAQSTLLNQIHADKVAADQEEEARLKKEKAKLDAMKGRPAGLDVPKPGAKPAFEKTPFEIDTKELETIKKQMASRLAVEKTAFDLRKTRQDSEHNNLITSDAKYYVDSLASAVKFETDSLSILKDSAVKFENEYKAKTDAITALRDKAKADPNEYKIQNDRLQKELNAKEAFLEDHAAKTAKIEADAAERTFKVADDAAGRVNKLAKSEKDYWDKTDMAKSKVAALKQIDQQYQYMNTSMFSMAEGEKASAIAILESNAASEERNKTLQDELKLQEDILQALKEMAANPATDPATAIAATAAIATAQIQVLRLGVIAKDSIDRGANEGAVAGTEAMNKVFQAKKEKFVTSIGDAVTTGIFDGAEAGQKKLRDMLVAALREPINTYVNVVVNSLTGAALDAIGISSKSSGGGAASSGFSALSPTSFGDAFGKFSTSSFGQSLGLSTKGIVDANQLYAKSVVTMTDTAASLAKGADMLGAALSYASAFDSASQGKWGQAIGQGLGQYIGGPIGSLIGGEIGKAVDEAFGGEKRSGGTYGLGEAYDLRTNTYNTLGKTATFMEGPSGGKLSETENLINTTALSVGKLLELVGSSSKLIGFQAGSETSDSGRGGVYSGGTLTGGVRFGETGAGSNYDGGKYEDTSSKNGSATEIAKNFGDDMLQVTIQALQAASDVPKTISDMLNGIDAESLGTVEATALLDSISKLATDARTLMEATGASVFDNLKGMSFDLAATLIAASGDVSGLVANLNTYYDKFYTGPEKTANATANLNKAFAAMNIVMPEIDENTRAWYRSEVERLGAMDLNIEANAKAYTSVLSLSGAVDALAPALAGAAAAVSKTLSSLSDARFGLENNLLKLQGKSDEADARIRQADFDKLTEGITDAASLMKIAASYDQNMGLEKLIKNLEEQKGLQEQLNAITDTAAQALTRQRNALDETNRGLFDQVQAATKAKEATQRLSESWAELAAMVPNTLAKYRTPEQNRDAQYASIGKGLQDYGFVSADVGIDSIIAQLKAANKDTILAISTLMFDGLAETSVDAAKALLGFVDTLADIKDNEASTALTALNKTLDDAKTAATAAMEAEKAISDQRKTLVEQLFQLTATEAEKSAAAAAKARAEVDPSNYDVYDQIVEKTAELKTASDAAATSVSALADQMTRFGGGVDIGIDLNAYNQGRFTGAVDAINTRLEAYSTTLDGLDDLIYTLVSAGALPSYDGATESEKLANLTAQYAGNADQIKSQALIGGMTVISNFLDQFTEAADTLETKIEASGSTLGNNLGVIKLAAYFTGFASDFGTLIDSIKSIGGVSINADTISTIPNVATLASLGLDVNGLLVGSTIDIAEAFNAGLTTVGTALTDNMMSGISESITNNSAFSDLLGPDLAKLSAIIGGVAKDDVQGYNNSFLLLSNSLIKGELTTEQFRTALDLTTDAFKNGAEAAGTAAETIQQAYDRLRNPTKTNDNIAQEWISLEDRLYAATDSTAEAAARARAAIDPFNIALYDTVIAAEKAKDVAAELAGLNTQLLTAQGDTIAQRNEERAKLDASNRALYDRINYLNDEKAVTAALQTVAQQYSSFVDNVTSTKSAVDSASEGITSGYLSAVDAVAAAQEQVNSVTQQAGEAMLGFAKSIREFVAGLDQAEAGGLNKRGQYAAATSDYTIALAQARAGDKDAMSKVAGLAGSMLGLGKETGTNAEDYRMLVAQTKGALSELATGAETANAFAAAVDPMLAAQENLAKAQAELVLWNKAISESGASTSKSVADYAADWRVANTSYQTALKDMLTADKLVAGLDMTLGTPIKDLAAAVAALAAATGLRDSTGLGVGGIAGGVAGGSVPGGPMTATQIDSYNSTLYAGINQSNIAADHAKGEKFSSDISAIDSAGGAAYRAVIAAGGLGSDALAAREAAVTQASVTYGYSPDMFEKRTNAIFNDTSVGAYDKFLAETLGYSSDTYDLNKRLGIPGFASGGYHSGGMRLVGENGPELEVTGPSQIYNAADTASMLRGGGANNAEVVAELRALAARLEAIERNTSATAGHTAKSARQSERVMPGGDAITVRVIT